MQAIYFVQYAEDAPRIVGKSFRKLFITLCNAVNFFEQNIRTCSNRNSKNFQSGSNLEISKKLESLTFIILVFIIFLKKTFRKMKIQIFSWIFFLFLKLLVTRRVQICIVVGALRITFVGCYRGWEAGGVGFRSRCLS